MGALVMTASDVCAVLDELPVTYAPGPAGIRVIRSRQFSELPDGRIENGSGIAGRGHHWSLVTDIPSGARGPYVGSRRELRRQIIEWLAGPRPAMTERQAERYELYPMLKPDPFGDRYIWIVRQKRGWRPA